MAADGDVGPIPWPEGEPGDIDAAASAWSSAAATAEAQAGTFGDALISAGTWRGAAASGFMGYCGELSTTLGDVADACRVAARACRHLSTTLEECQRRVRRAQRAYLEAEGEERDHQRAASSARATADAKGRESEAAAQRAVQARAAGPHGAPAADAADRDSHAAGVEATRAADAASRAADAALAAGRRKEEATRAGRRAYEEAMDAGRTARSALARVGQAARPPGPITPGTIPLLPDRGGPVTPPGALIPRAPTPFDPDGPQFGRSPAQVLAALDDAYRAEHEQNAGTVGDFASGIAHTLTFGAADLGGDPDSTRYRRGEVEGLVLSPGAAGTGGRIVRGVGRFLRPAAQGARREAAVAKRLEQEAAERAKAGKPPVRSRPGRAGRRVDEAEAERVAARNETLRKYGKEAVDRVAEVLPAGTARSVVVDLVKSVLEEPTAYRRALPHLGEQYRKAVIAILRAMGAP